MLNQVKNSLTLFNSVLTISTEEGVEYNEMKSEFHSSKSEKQMFKLSLPKSIDKNSIKLLLITVYEKNSLKDGQYFKLFAPKTKHFILRPLFEADYLKVDYENIQLDTSGDLQTTFILKLKNEFLMKEREAFVEIYDYLKSNIKKNSNFTNMKYYNPDISLRIYSAFEQKYISGGLSFLRRKEDFTAFFKMIIRSSFLKEQMEDVLKCVYTYFSQTKEYKDAELVFKNKETTETGSQSFEEWPNVFASVFSETLSVDNLKFIKEYLLVDINNVNNIENSVCESIASDFKSALETYYEADTDSLSIKNVKVDFNNTKTNIQGIIKILKLQYSCFHWISAEIHRIANFTKQTAEVINNYSGSDINEFKKTLIAYPCVFYEENRKIILSYIQDLKTEIENFVKGETRFELFNDFTGDQRVLQFTLIFDGSKYVYPEFYTFTGDALEPLVNN